MYHFAGKYYKMRISVVILCSALVLLHGASCHRFSTNVLKAVDMITSNSRVTKNYKRQDDIDECVNNGLDSSDFSDQCKAQIAALEALDMDFVGPPTALQSAFNTIFSVFCDPECGNPLLQLLIDCGIEDDSPGEVDFIAGLCGTQRNGDKCYESLVVGKVSTLIEASCYINFTVDGTCECKSELQTAVEVQGCCIDVYQDYLRALADEDDFDYNPNDLYDECGVDLPGGCNNSPVSSSIALVSTTNAVIAALMLSVAVILG